MIMPNFLVIGTQKAGTSALNAYLKEHPQIYMSPIKETGFFDFEGQQVNFCGPGDENSFRFAINDLSAYQNVFRDVSDEIAIGEATTWYLQSPKAPERIKYHMPNAKLIAILRNPVDRAYSAFVHALRDDLEPINNFAQALLEEDKRIKNNWGYIRYYKHMGFYAEQLKRYFQYFDRDQIRVYLYEDLNSNPHQVLQDIFQFLGVDENFRTEVFTRHNISGIQRSKAFDSFLYNKDHPFKKFFKPIVPGKLRKHLVNYLKINNRVKPKFPEEIREDLTNLFREDVLELELLIQRSLSTWLE